MEHSFKNLSLLFLLLVCECFASVPPKTISFDSCKPEQIHIALGATKSQMSITWSTECDPGSSIVRYSDDVKGMSFQAEGTSEKLAHYKVIFIPCKSRYIHKVVLTGLIPGQSYSYCCGSEKGWSNDYLLCTVKDSTDWSPELFIFGDLGVGSATVVTDLIKEANKESCQVFVPNGDLAYNLNSDCGRVGDQFFREIQAFAAIRPVMPTVGNHEFCRNFSDYKARFNMPGTDDNMFYTYNLGPATIIAACSEVYYESKFFFGLKSSIHKDWIERTLQEANLPENRKIRPWIIFLIHRPFYCSAGGLRSILCTLETKILRNALEPVLCKYGVDLVITSHAHFYERFLPVYNKKVYVTDLQNPYKNPKAPVHILTGSAGSSLGQYSFSSNHVDSSVVRSTELSYTKLIISNGTHLYWEQIPKNSNGTLIDSVWLIKDNHGPYTELNCNT